MKLRNIIGGLALTGFSVFGCDKNEKAIELSDLINEECIVTELTYIPKHTKVKSTSGIGYDGKFRMGSSKRVQIPDKFKVVFNKSGEDKFVIEGNGDREKNIWGRFSLLGGRAKISYRKKYESTYDCSKAEKALLEKKLIGYEFIDAEKIQN